MNGMNWIYSKDMFAEYNEITTAFFNLFRKEFTETCTIPMLFPNYVAIRYDSPEGSKGVRCFKLNDRNEFLLNAYPEICCREITNETISSLPDNVKGAVIDLDVFDCARWIYGGFMMFSIGISNTRTRGDWILTDSKTASDIWDFVYHIKNDYVKFMACTVETVIRKEKPVAFGLMDFDPAFIVPYLS